MQRHHARCQRQGGADRAGDGVGNVVQLEVEEDRDPRLAHLTHALGSGADEELQAELQAVDAPGEAAREGERGGQRRRIEGGVEAGGHRDLVHGGRGF